jgi:IclR family acetate operon transcriptional repressor
MPGTPTLPPRMFTPPRSIGRVLQILKMLAQRARPMTLAELSSEFDVPRTSLFSILKGLQQEGYVIFEHDAYSLGPESTSLGQAITQGETFPASAQPVLERLGKLTSETIILSTLADDRQHVIYTSVFEAQSALRFTVNVGTTRPLNASALGQAVLSYLPAAERKAYLEQDNFQRFTPRTVTTAAALRKLIKQVRQEHCAMTIDGTVVAAVGIAAPYFDSRGAVKGSVNIAGPTERMIKRVDEFKAAIVAGGQEISRILAYTGTYPPDAA